MSLNRNVNVPLVIGGALGYEGPSIYIGAALGTWLQRRFRRLFGIEDAKLVHAAGSRNPMDKFERCHEGN